MATATKTQAAQVPLAHKAARVKAANKKKESAPQLTPKQIDALNRKAQLAADTFVEEKEEHEHEKPLRLLTKRQVLARIPLTYPTIWAWMRAGKFPRALEVGGKTCWREEQINEWIMALPLRPLKGDKPAEAAP